MMRAVMALFWGLVIFWLLTADADAQTAPSPVPWPRTVEGNSPDSLDKARRIAFDNARERILDYLRRQSPPMTSWQPSIDDIVRILLESERAEPDFKEGDYVFKRFVLTLRPEDPERFRRLDRQAYLELEKSRREVRRAERTLVAAKVVLGLLVLAAAVLIYIRLDERTHGSYTRWLQAAMAMVVASTSVGLWMLP
jgi:hypothetical protein